MSIIIPAYNEERRIRTAITELSSAFPGSEIIVVADGKDRTAEIAAECGKELPVSVISVPVRAGKWGAIRMGIEAARGDVAAFIDADLSVSAKEARRLAAMLGEKRCDLIAASRYREGSGRIRNQPASRIFLSRAFNLLESLMFGLTMRDTQCGFKVFGSSIGKRAAALMTCRGFEGDVEFIWLVRRLGGKILEEPVDWEDSDGTSIRFYHMLLMAMGLAKARLRWLFRNPWR